MNIVFLFFLSACMENDNTTETTTKPTPVEQQTPPAKATKKKPPPPPKEISSPFVGNWTSPSCGERKYERQLFLYKNKKLKIRDLVSPCPPDKKCVWSGIHTFNGAWKPAGDNIKVKYSNVKEDLEASLPTSFQWEQTGPAELDGVTPCVYTPQPKAKNAAKKDDVKKDTVK